MKNSVLTDSTPLAQSEELELHRLLATAHLDGDDDDKGDDDTDSDDDAEEGDGHPWTLDKEEVHDDPILGDKDSGEGKDDKD